MTGTHRAAPTVDVHAHVVVPEAEQLVASRPELARAREQEAVGLGPESLAVNHAQDARLRPALTDPAARIAAMEAASIDVQVVSTLPLHHYWADRALAAEYADAVNEGVARHCAFAPGRLLGLGTAPLQHPDLAAEILSNALAAGLRGITVSTRVAERELSDPSLQPVWARAEELGAVVFVHPWGCSLGARLDTAYLANIVGQPTETTVALSHLIFGGVLDRHPGLRIVAAHGGGYLPAYIGRSDHAWQVRPDSRTCRERPSSYLRRMWFDSLVYAPQGLSQLVSAVGADRIVIGTDYPFDMGVSDPLARLAAAGLDPDATETIRAGAASTLLGAPGSGPRPQVAHGGKQQVGARSQTAEPDHQ